MLGKLHSRRLRRHEGLRSAMQIYGGVCQLLVIFATVYMIPTLICKIHMHAMKSRNPAAPKKRKRGKSMEISQLPRELIDEILVLVDTKTMVRFMRSSKLFYASWVSEWIWMRRMQAFGLHPFPIIEIDPKRVEFNQQNEACSHEQYSAFNHSKALYSDDQWNSDSTRIWYESFKVCYKLLYLRELEPSVTEIWTISSITFLIREEYTKIHHAASYLFGIALKVFWIYIVPIHVLTRHTEQFRIQNDRWVENSVYMNFLQNNLIDSGYIDVFNYEHIPLIAKQGIVCFLIVTSRFIARIPMDFTNFLVGSRLFWVNFEFEGVDIMRPSFQSLVRSGVLFICEIFGSISGNANLREGASFLERGTACVAFVADSCILTFDACLIIGFWVYSIFELLIKPIYHPNLEYVQ